MRQRLIRVLVYEGPPEFIAKSLANRSVKGSHSVGNCLIREAIVGDFLEILDNQPEQPSCNSKTS